MSSLLFKTLMFFFTNSIPSFFFFNTKISHSLTILPFTTGNSIDFSFFFNVGGKVDLLWLTLGSSRGWFHVFFFHAIHGGVTCLFYNYNSSRNRTFFFCFFRGRFHEGEWLFFFRVEFPFFIECRWGTRLLCLFFSSSLVAFLGEEFTKKESHPLMIHTQLF